MSKSVRLRSTRTKSLPGSLPSLSSWRSSCRVMDAGVVLAIGYAAYHGGSLLDVCMIVRWETNHVWIAVLVALLAMLRERNGGFNERAGLNRLLTD